MDIDTFRSTLPDSVSSAVSSLFEAIPPADAMTLLVGARPRNRPLAVQVIRITAICNRPELVAAIWLYVDELDKSHAISQRIDTPTGAFLHGIMHRREGDFWNSHYWFRRVGEHPAMGNIADYNPHAFIDAVENAPPDDQNLLDLQRREWAALFSWCANR